MDIGQEFAVRWLCKNYPVKSAKGQEKVDEIDLCQEIALAVNAYADKKRAEFETVLRTAIVDVLEDEESSGMVTICARDLLESDCMKHVAHKLPHSPFERPVRFPRSLKS